MPSSTTCPDPFAGSTCSRRRSILLDANCVIRHFNPAAENLFGGQQRQLPGSPLRQLSASPRACRRRSTMRLNNNWSYTGHNIEIKPRRGRAAASRLHGDAGGTPAARACCWNCGRSTSS